MIFGVSQRQLWCMNGMEIDWFCYSFDFEFIDSMSSLTYKQQTVPHDFICTWYFILVDYVLNRTWINRIYGRLALE